MQILHVVPSFGFGGMEKIICQMIQSTSENSHVLLALNSNTQAKEWINNVDVRILPFTREGSRFTFFNALYRALHSVRPDLLMTYNWGSTDALWLGRLAGIRNIVHNEHGFNADEVLTTDWKRDVIRFIVYRIASKVIVVSHELESILKERFRIAQSHVQRIPNGIDTDLFYPNEAERQRMRKSLGFEDSHLVIGFSGRLDPVKNLDLLMNIFKRTNPSAFPFRLLLVGDGPERPRLESLCRASGWDNYVRFCGAQREVLPYLRAMDVFLLPSSREQMPLTVLEAMSVGLPVIATRVGELPYMINDGSEGFLRDLNAPVEEFVEALHALLCSSLHKTLGAAARKKVVEHFQIEEMLGRYSDIIRDFSVSACDT